MGLGISFQAWQLFLLQAPGTSPTFNPSSFPLDIPFGTPRWKFSDRDIIPRPTVFTVTVTCAAAMRPATSPGPLVVVQHHPPGKTRRAVACNHCRAKKIRCMCCPIPPPARLNHPSSSSPSLCLRQWQCSVRQLSGSGRGVCRDSQASSAGLAASAQ